MARPVFDPKSFEAQMERKYGSKMVAFVLAHAIEFLIRRGSAILDQMANTHETKRRTGAQENAYMMGIYLDGELIYMRFPAVRPQREPKGKDTWGRREAMEYLKASHPEAAGIVVVFLQAMYYSFIQEELGTSRHGTWKITTQCDNMVDILAADFNAKFPNMPCHWNRLQDLGYI